jgi:hypothetical protein
MQAHVLGGYNLGAHATTLEFDGFGTEGPKFSEKQGTKL